MPSLDLPAGSPLRSLDPRSPALVVFLRSFGCTFCREAMADVAAAKAHIQSEGAQIAFVHGASPDEAAPWFSKYALGDVTVISDPGLAHYRAFGLGRTGAQSLVAPRVWTRGAVCALSHGFGVQSVEMLRQLPGVFVIQNGAVLREFRHRSPADRPDYLSLVMAARPVDAKIGLR
jgi:peroxiredoxin